MTRAYQFEIEVRIRKEVNADPDDLDGTAEASEVEALCSTLEKHGYDVHITRNATIELP
jgi:hypothetical protein